ncbi:Serine phosphatase RsbU, regulator of sigma subunit [Olavius sp. associated proteobacterium Delta 1]|nr:Serine phosphatase RsbU, regulator of sigma subunit [Olavius sp. associated proteobacterium Delta 1]
MKKLKFFYLRNQMLVANGIANFIGVFLAIVLIHRAEPFPKELFDNPIIYWTDALFDPFAFSFVIVMTLLYEKPIRHYLNALSRRTSISEDLKLKARQRLLNEPFVLIALDFSIWVLWAIVWSTIHWAYDSGTQLVQRSLYNGLSIGLITITVAFFLLEHLLQKRLAPFFFPDGGLSAIPKTLRIRIRTRLVALLFACNLIPLISIILILYRILGSQYEPALALAKLQSAININALVFIGVGIFLTILVSRNLSIPFRDIIQTLGRIRNGRFDKRVQVFSNDEIGYTGDAINEMTKGLIERERMQLSLNLAKEVQQNLLPKSNLKVNGFDIAGKSVYCDETGGDYYDFIIIDDAAEQKIGVAIGDVSGHGISSALLMATVRSSLRQRASLPGSTAKIISDVNRQLVKDVEDSGQFMTMFFLALDTVTRQLEWVRAGHDPAMLYDPGSGSFSELGGSGIALGVDGEWIFENYKKTDFSNGQIIFLSTDGIWEARNKKGEMLGKEPILNLIRQNASSNATQILDAVFNGLDKFIGGVKIDDDITSVVIKMQN